MPRLRVPLAIALTAAVVVAGCSSVGEEIAERAIEGAAEANGENGDVEVDFDQGDGNISIETTEGSLQIGSQELPEEFPADIPIPDNAQIIASMSFDDGDQANHSATMTVPDTDVDTLVGDLRSRLEGAGYTVTNEFSQDGGGSQTRSVTFDGTEWVVNLVVAGTADEITVNYTVTTPSA